MSDETSGRFAFFLVIALAAWFTRLIGKWHNSDAGLLAGIAFSIIIGGMLAGLIASGLAPMGLRDAAVGYLIAVGVGFGGSGASSVVYWLMRRAERLRSEAEEAEGAGDEDLTPPGDAESVAPLTRRDEDGE